MNNVCVLIDHQHYLALVYDVYVQTSFGIKVDFYRLYMRLGEDPKNHGHKRP